MFMSRTANLPRRGISPETLLLFVFGVLDIGILRQQLPLPFWITLANLFWPLVLGCLISDLSPLGALARNRIKTAGVALAIFVLAGIGTMAMIGLRRTVSPHRYVHDNAVLIEAGIQQLMAGRNIYAVDFRGTALAAWQGGKFFDASSNTWFDNPALDHYITLPFYTAASVPFGWVSARLLGFYDQRFVDLAAYAVICIVTYALLRRGRIIGLLLLALNPLQVHALLVGTSDTFVLALLLVAVWFCARQRWMTASVMLALAANSKQTSWLVIPFLLAYGYALFRHAGLGFRSAIGRCARQFWPLPAVFALIAAPFFFWNPQAFLDDVYRYPAGLLPTSFPIFGEGLSVLLQLLGFPATPRSYFPYGLLEIVIAGPVFGVLMVWLIRRPSLGRALGSSGVLLLTFLWLSRFFNENYITLPLALFGLAVVMADEAAAAPEPVG